MINASCKRNIKKQQPYNPIRNLSIDIFNVGIYGFFLLNFDKARFLDFTWDLISAISGDKSQVVFNLDGPDHLNCKVEGIAFNLFD
jgi:hypothetical protein